MQSLESRINNLERTVKRQRLVSSGLGLALAILVATGAAKQNDDSTISKVVKTRRLEVIGADSAAKIVAEASGTNDTCTLRMFGQDGKPRIEATAESQYGGYSTLSFKSPEGDTRAHIGTRSDGNGLIGVGSKQAKLNTVEITSDDSGGGQVSVMNATSGLGVHLATTKDGGGSVGAFSPTGGKGAILGASPSGGMCAIYNFGDKPEDSKPLAWLGIEKGRGALRIGTDPSEGLCLLSVDEAGNGALGVWNKNRFGGCVLTSDERGAGCIAVIGKNREEGGCTLGVDEHGSGTIGIETKAQKNLILLGATPDEAGGMIHVLNKTGESVCRLTVDEYGNGKVSALDRYGKGRSLTPGP